MNNKGQSTVIFIILIPVFLLILAFIFDGALKIVEENRYKEVTKTIMEDVLVNSYTDKVGTVKDLYEKNKYETDMLEATYEDGYIEVYNSHTYTSFFGKILGINTYRTELHLKGHMENDKLITEEIKKEG